MYIQILFTPVQHVLSERSIHAAQWHKLCVKVIFFSEKPHVIGVSAGFLLYSCFSFFWCLKTWENGTDRRDKQKTGLENEKAGAMKGRNGDPEQSECKHYVFCFLKQSVAPLPLTSTMTRRKQEDTPLSCTQRCRSCWGGERITGDTD